MKTQNRKFQILPSILSADFGKFIEEAQSVDIPEIEFLHVDVMDGHFVPNLTFGPSLVESLRKHTRFKLDVHLMIEDVPQYLPRFVDAGADILTFHQEAERHSQRYIQKIKEYGIRAGISINPATPLESIQWILADVDLVLIMSVNPGFGGQKYIPGSTEKIAELNRLKISRGLDFVIEVDGGIHPATAAEAYRAGAEYLVAGNAVFGEPDRPKAIRKIIQSVEREKIESSSRLV
ncbi:MAG TPA: ribulose-phosphate 3-epimerase [Caldithrix sp.]|nr:ribulose-phosphate 3-epimerase [Caldithrix sp.]